MQSVRCMSGPWKKEDLLPGRCGYGSIKLRYLQIQIKAGARAKGLKKLCFNSEAALWPISMEKSPIEHLVLCPMGGNAMVAGELLRRSNVFYFLHGPS